MTEITNVGGMDGVASEATLLKLLEAQKQAGRSSGQMERLATQARDKATKSTSLFGKATDLAGKAVTGYTNILKNGVGGLSDFTDNMKILPGFMRGMIRYADESVNTFRNITEVGGTFGNNMLELQAAAAKSGIAMNNFFELIGGNSERLTFLGGSVTEGTKRFSDISKGLRSSDLGQRLFELGMTSEQINEGFLTYTENMQRQGRLSRMTDQQLIEGSGQYLHQLNLLSKLTGASRKELEEQQRAQNTSVLLQMKMAKMTDDERARFMANMTLVTKNFPSAADDIEQIALGIAGSDLDVVMNTFGGQAGATMIRHLQNMEKTDPEAFNAAMRDVIPKIRENINSFDEAATGVATSSGSAVSALTTIGTDLQTAFTVDPETLKKEMSARDSFTAALTKFSEQISALSSFIANEFLGSETFKQLEKLGTSLTSAFSTLLGPESVTGSFDNASKTLKDNVTSLDGFVANNLIAPLTTEIEKFKTHIAEGGDAGTYFKTKITELGNNLKEWFSELFFGSQDGETKSKGLITSVTESITNAFNSPTFQAQIDGIVDTIKPIITQAIRDLMKMLNDTWLGYIIPNSSFESPADAEIQELTNSLNNDLAALGYAKQYGYLDSLNPDSVANTQATIDRLRELGQTVNIPEGLPVRRVGTLRATGRPTEPTDTVAQIHKGERVLNPQEAAAYNNQSDVVGAVNRLNNTTMQLVGLMSQTNRGVRGISNDFLKGALTV